MQTVTAMHGAMARCCKKLGCRKLIQWRTIRIPSSEQELFSPSNKPLTYISENTPTGLFGFEVVRRHFPNAWGFLWSPESAPLTDTLERFSRPEREDAYAQLARGDFSELRKKVDEVDHVDGLMILGQPKGRKLIDEAYRYLGVPPTLVSYMSDLCLIDIPGKVPLGWMIKAVKCAYNIHPAPPEFCGAGLYVPTIALGRSEYAVTIHLMNHLVDNGEILLVKRFPFPAGTTVTQLRDMTRFNYYKETLEELLLRIKFTDGPEDMPRSCHYAYGWGSESTRAMVRKMKKELDP